MLKYFWESNFWFSKEREILGLKYRVYPILWFTYPYRPYKMEKSVHFFISPAAKIHIFSWWCLQVTQIWSTDKDFQQQFRFQSGAPAIETLYLLLIQKRLPFKIIRRILLVVDCTQKTLSKSDGEQKAGGRCLLALARFVLISTFACT